MAGVTSFIVNNTNKKGERERDYPKKMSTQACQGKGSCSVVTTWRLNAITLARIQNFNLNDANILYKAFSDLKRRINLRDF